MGNKKRIIDVEEWDKWYAELTYNLEPYDHYDMGYGDAVDRIDDWMDAQPIVDIDAGLVGQYRWERDVAISQLEELGIGFGQKIDGKYISEEDYVRYLQFKNMYMMERCKKSTT